MSAAPRALLLLALAACSTNPPPPPEPPEPPDPPSSEIDLMPKPPRLDRRRACQLDPSKARPFEPAAESIRVTDMSSRT